MKNLIFIFLLIEVMGCKELFEPKIDAEGEIMVVDGLISNDSVNYVKLFFALPFNSSSKNIPVENAIVTVQDTSGKSYQMHENAGGLYKLDSMEFKAKIGGKYKLFITTSDGEQYQSDAQIMEEPLPIDTIYGESIVVPYLEEVDRGDRTIVERKSIVTFIDIHRSDSNTTNLRFVNTLLIEVIWELPYQPHTWYYGWYLKKIDEHINLTETNKNEKGNDILKFDESIFTLEQNHFAIPDSEVVWNWVLIIKEYAINNDTYKYYADINKQISSTGALFDPLTSQLTGNIHCTSNPKKKTLGFFEVSAYQFHTYVIPSYLPNNIVTYRKTENISDIPLYRKLLPNGKPYFWK